VYWDLDAHSGGPGQTIGRLERTRTFDGEEHARVWGSNVVPTVFLDEVGLEPEQPPVGTGVGGTESVCGGERDTSPGSPVVHPLYATRKRDDGERGVGHCGRGTEDRRWRWARRGEGGPGGRRVLMG